MTTTTALTEDQKREMIVDALARWEADHDDTMLIQMFVKLLIVEGIERDIPEVIKGVV